MPKLAVRFALSLAAAVVVMTGLQALLIRHPPAVRAAVPTDEAPVQAPVDVPRFGLAPAGDDERTRRPPRRSGFGTACIRGRVLASTGSLPDDLEVQVEDGSRTYEVRVEGETFEVHLPVGSYTVEASAGDEVGFAEVADLVADENREVVLRLVPGVAIAGTVQGCDGPCPDISVEARVPGSDREAASTDSDDRGAFEVDGLIPGRLYDLVFHADGKRQVTMRGVPAPRQGVVATMEDAPTLTGGFGIEPGKKCPMRVAVVQTPGNDDPDLRSDFDRQCHFEITDLPGTDSVHLTAEGDGWHFAVDVPLPAHGDPPFLCLRPPCRDLPPEPTAQLFVAMTDALRHRAYVSVIYPDDEFGSGGTCGGGEGQCKLDDLRVGRNVSVIVRSDGCERRVFKTELRPGANHLAFTCETVRSIQGILRGSREHLQAMVAVRCADGSPPRHAHGRLFQLDCPSRLGAIEYQIGDEQDWHNATIVADGEGDGFVEITTD